MIYSPVEMMVTFENAKSKVVKGVLLEKAEMSKVIKLIDRSNANGLKGYDAMLLMRLKDAAADLTEKKAVKKPVKGKAKPKSKKR